MIVAGYSDKAGVMGLQFLYIRTGQSDRTMKEILLAAFLLWGGATAAQQPAADEPFVITRIEPQFRGGDLTSFRRWAEREFTERCLRCNPSLAEMWNCSPFGTRVVLAFWVDELGRVDSTKVLQSPDRFFSEQAVAAAEASPRWTPGRRLVRRADGSSEWIPARMRVVCPFDLRSTRELEDSLSAAGIARTARFTTGRGLTFPEWAASQAYEAARRDDVACMADTVWVRFRIDSQGNVRDAKATAWKYAGTARCAERIVASSPRWLPEVIDRKPVETERRVRVIFRSDEESVLGGRERMPSFEGGDLHAFHAWVERQVERRMSGKQGVGPGLVLLRFVVNEEGEVTDVEIVRSENPLLAAAARDVVRSSPRWTPGAVFTRPEMPCNCRVVWKSVKVKFTLPVGFRLSDAEVRAALREMNAASKQ